MLTIFTIFTIGHSNHPLERFLELLSRHAIGSLADIRRFPSSRAHPHFNRDALEAALNERAITYRWFEELGGRRSRSADAAASPNGGLRNDSFRNFADYMLTPEFREGVQTLMTAAQKRPTAIMCAESLFWRCHRRLVSDYLVANDVSVKHIFPNGSLKEHTPTPGALIQKDRVTYPPSPTLFDEQPGAGAGRRGTEKG